MIGGIFLGRGVVMKRKQILPAAAVLLSMAAFALLMVRSAANITRLTAATPRTAATAVLIDPGHGGEDGGAVCGEVQEKQINLAVSRDLADLLTLCGYEVELTRDSDNSLSDEGETVRKRKNNDMKARLALYNASAYRVVLSIHQNKFNAASSRGAQVFYSPNDGRSAVLAERIRFAVTALLQPDNERECKKAGKEIFLLKNAEVPAVLVECGFISNPQERELLLTDAYQKQMALAVAAGFINFDNTDNRK